MRTRLRIAGALVLLAGLAALFASVLPAAAQQPPSEAAKPLPAFEKLKGRWLRDTGGYIVEIRGVEPGGKMDAAYFNPRSIHVGKAEASQKGGAVQVFIGLRDVNYPGSTYTLTYDAKTDRLVGRYYQAVAGETFDVFFVRLKG
jgi:uncharacterized protein (DUF2147 family)